METFKLKIDDRQINAGGGDTVLQAALKAGIYIPNLCYDPRLAPYGGCRMCIVEIEGTRGFPAACTTRASDGMVVKTYGPQLDRLRLDTLELLLSDHPTDCLTCPGNQRCELQKVASFLGYNQRSLKPRKSDHPIDDSNPFFNLDRNYCVLCARCVRTCDEVTGINAIELINRGDESRVSTFAGSRLAESECRSCGECMVSCPVGAIHAKNSPVATEETATICPYCGVGCGIYLGTRQGKIVSVRGNEASPSNRGSLCVKGRFGINEFVHHSERLKSPRVKKEGGFESAEWEEALRIAGDKLSGYKPEEVAVIASAKATNEDNYVLQKFTRAVLGTNNIDHCARL